MQSCPETTHCMLRRMRASNRNPNRTVRMLQNKLQHAKAAQPSSSLPLGSSEWPDEAGYHRRSPDFSSLKRRLVFDDFAVENTCRLDGQSLIGSH